MKPNKFISTIRESFKGSEIVYTHGSCYRFYKILKVVFPDAEAYYNSDHVITKINGKYYDITGEVEKENHITVKGNYDSKKMEELIFDLEERLFKTN